jgi:hypothetical protein
MDDKDNSHRYVLFLKKKKKEKKREKRKEKKERYVLF